MTRIKRIDFNKVLSNFAGDKNLLKGTVNLSIKYLPTYFDRIKIALSSKNIQELELAAHTLKGSLSIYLYKPIVEIAFELEKMCHNQSRFHALLIGWAWLQRA